ncbi:MAG: tryptophan halogenase family protein [Burkholderiales bacterium]
MSAPPVNNVLIVGGGTAGWMAATFLATHFRNTGRTVSLVESSNVPTIGVGEATVPTLVAYLRQLGIDETEFMRRSHATYKLGIRFTNWRAGNDTYWHPFGVTGGRIDELELFHFWLKSIRNGYPEGPFSSYSLQVLLAEQERSPRPLSGTSVVIDRGQYAYHLDAGAFAEFLKGIAIERGTRHLVDDVTRVVVGENGLIAGIHTREHGLLEADLYIDCSGFKAMLAEEALGDGYVDWSNTLLCDYALAAPQPSSASMPPYTRSTALSAGWAWQIPLTHRVGNGYVFCSRFIEKDAAVREFATLLGVEADSLEPRVLKMRVGHRRNFWRGNCVAIGLASGFVEPLESTGLLLIQRGMEVLLEYFPDKSFDPGFIKRYNERMQANYEEIRDFILLHYVLTQRTGDPFWDAYRNVPLPDSLADLLQTYRRTGTVEIPRHSVFRESSWYSILTGMNCLPQTYHPRADLSDFEKIRHILGVIVHGNRETAATLPPHRDYIEAINAPGQPG